MTQRTSEPWRNTRKRVFDVCVAAAALLCLAIPLACLVWLVRRKLGRPVFFRQVRPGITGLWLHPQTPLEQDMGVWLQGFYANAAPLPDNFLAERQDLPPQERDWA